MKIVKKILKWLGIGIGALLVLIILAALIMNVIFGRELRQTMEQLKAEGRALTIAEIRPAPIPDDQNAAPLLQKAGEMMGYGFYTNPPLKAAAAIKELSDLIYSNQTADISTWPVAHREALPRLIHAPEMTQLFAVLHEASQKPGYNNSLNYEDGLGKFLPNLGSTRQITRFLIINAELAAQNGNTEKAWATVLEALELVDLLQQEPILVTQLTRIACDRVMIDCMERMADKTDIPADQAQALIAELAQHTDATPWIRAMDFDRAMLGVWYFQIVQHGSFTDCNAQVSTKTNIHRWLYRTLGFPMVCILKRDFSVYLKLMTQIQDYYKVPYWKAAETIRNHPLDQQIPRFCNWTSSTLADSEYGLVVYKTAHDAAIAVARVGLGLKLFQQKNGAYPETLDKLSPEFLDTIPVDPFTGKALIYRKADEGFILYSVGPNLQDDNGTPKPTGNNATGKEPYDIVWKCER